MKRKKQVDKRIRDLFKLPENRYNLELLYKFLSQPAKGLSLCRVLPEERFKIFGFFKSDASMDRIHIINMVKPLRGLMDLQQTIIDTWEKFGPGKNIFFIYNIESCIYVSKTSPKAFFREMNLIRDFFMQFEAVFVFFVTESSVKKMIQNAFDFYDWMKFTFTFESEHRDLFLQPIEIREVEGAKYSNPRKKIGYLVRTIEKTANERDKSVLLYESGMLYRQVNDYDAALKRLLESLKIEEKYRDRINAAKRYNQIALVYQEKGDPDKALEFAVKAAEIFEKNNAAKDLAAAYNNISRIYQDKSDTDRALEFTLKAAEIFKENNDATGLAITYNNIGQIYKDKGDPDRALKSGFLMALDIFEKANDTANMAKNFNNIGLIYHAQGNSDKALEFVFKALEFFEKNNDRENLAVVYSNIGRIYQSRGNKKDAVYYLDRSVTDKRVEFNWDKLLTRIKRKNVIPVIGQGLYRIEIESKDKSPRLLYEYLAEQVIKECGAALHPDENPTFARACFAFLKKNWNDYFPLSEFLSEKLEGIRLIPADSLWKLARIKPFQIFITTAYDSFLLDTTNTVRRIPTELFAYSLLEKDLSSMGSDLFERINDSQCILVYHIFGSLGESLRPAYTEADILETILEFGKDMHMKYRNMLFEKLRNSSFLFMGCGYDDWLYRLFIRIMADNPFGSTSREQTVNFVADNFNENKKDPFQELPRFLMGHGAEVFQSEDNIDFVDLLFDKLQLTYPEEIIPSRDFPGKEGEITEK